MKHSLPFLLAFLLAFLLISPAALAVSFDENAKYRISCRYADGGMVTIGANHNAKALLYYYQGDGTPADAWWYIKKAENGYTLQNAKDGTYITYNSERIEQVQKGLVLSETAEGGESQWSFTARDGYWIIANAAHAEQWFNLRTDGTGLLGTYTGNTGSNNELFTIYDESGKAVTDGGGEGGGGTATDPDDFSAETGQTALGEYWERKGVANPVVCTTDTSDPVLYSIANLRTQNYVKAASDGLRQTANSAERTRFYFVEQEKGVQVFTADGQCVSTDFPLSSQGNSALQTAERGAAGTGNVWSVSHSSGDVSVSGYTGYALCKEDNLSTDAEGGWGGWESQQSDYRYWNDYNSTLVGLYDLDSGSTFVFTSADARHKSSLERQGISFAGGGTVTPSGQLPTAYADSLLFNGKELVYDSKSKTYFAPIPTTLQDGGTLRATLRFLPKAACEGYTARIDGAAPEEGTDSVRVENVTCAKTYALTIHNAEGGAVSSAPVQFTFLPIVEVSVGSCNSTYYTTGSIRVTDAGTEGYDSLFVAAFKYRGATSLRYEKKSYAIKLRDERGNSVDRKLLGLRSDNNWILDAMAIDPACMRNRVATDLWNDFCTGPYYKDREKKARTGTRGKFVEVFLNGKYHGLYCMTEKMDRKQLKLKKYENGNVHGLLYKSAEWSYEVFFGHESDSRSFPRATPRPCSNSLGQETWASFEQKYPDATEEAACWNPLRNAVNFVATSGQEKFDAGIAEQMDRPLLDDYYLFIDLLLATDNHGKNMFFYVYDREGAEGDRVSVAPWDLDGVWGLRWDGGTTYTRDATQDFDTFIWNHEHGQNTIFHKLRESSTLDWADNLAARYAELRKKWFNEDNLSQRVSDYAALFAGSGADTREQGLWGKYHSGIQEAAAYMREWIASRVSALDKKYGYDPTTTGVSTAKRDGYFRAEGGSGCVAVNAGRAQAVRVYTAGGVCVKTAAVPAGVSAIGGLQPGVYIVNGQKVAVR